MDNSITLSSGNEEPITLQSVDDPTTFILVGPTAGPSNPGVQSVVAGTNVTVDSTDPAHPVISASVSGGGGTGTTDWGSILGTLSDQTDLQSALDAKQNSISSADNIAEGIIHLFLTATERTKLSNTSGVNTGDQDLGGLVPKNTTVNGHALSANVTVSQSDVGLSNVDNTNDASKPVSTAQQTAIDAKVEDAVIDGHTTVAPSGNAVHDALALKQDSLGYTAENTANKGVTNGYASLDATGKVPALQLPSYVDDVLEYANLAAFPASGSSGIIYVTDDTNKTYRWSGTAYVEISPSPGSTDAVPEGSTNLYYTNARASAAAPVQSVAGRTGVVALTKSDVGLSSVTNALQLVASNNLSDLGSASTARTNLGLGSIATKSTITLTTDVTGVLPAANGGAGTVTGIMKANGSGTVSAAVSGTDYAPAPSGSSILKANGSGGFTSATAGTDYTTPSDTETLSNKRITQRVVPLTDGATITVNTDITDVCYVTLGGNRTLAFSGTPNGGDKLTIRLKQDATGSRTVTWPTSVRWSTDNPAPTLSTTASKTDYVFLEYNAADSKWDGLAVNKGF